MPKGNPMKTFLNIRNNLTMLYKNLPEKDLRPVMRWRWFLDYLAAIEMLLLNHSLSDFKAIFRARRAFKKWRPIFKEDRDCNYKVETSVARRFRIFDIVFHFNKGNIILT